MTVNRRQPVSKTLDSGTQPDNTDWLALKAGQRASVSIQGTFSGQVRLQCQLPGQATPDNVETPDGGFFTAPSRMTFIADETCQIRLRVESGDLASGAAECRLGVGTGA